MPSFIRHLCALALLMVVAQSVGDAAPPYSGTIFIEKNLLTANDPTAFVGVSYVSTGIRNVFDRRTNAFSNITMHLVSATYLDVPAVEIRVNPEFGLPDAAMVEAEKYGRLLGQLPAVLRSKAITMTIHQGVQPFGGGVNNILIHTGQSALYEAQGIIEETLVHEASHTSLDPDHTNAAGWVAAQRADPEFISTYARDNPTREDVAETFLMHLAFRHRRDRITTALATMLERTIPARINYFDQQNFNLFPFVTFPATIAAVSEDQDVETGQRTTLNVVANGSIPMSYQWFLGASPDMSSPIEGANSNSFETPEMSGSAEFWVRASNPYGPVANSRTIMLRVR